MTGVGVGGGEDSSGDVVLVETGCHFTAIPSRDRRNAKGTVPAIKCICVGHLCRVYISGKLQLSQPDFWRKTANGLMVSVCVSMPENYSDA